MQHREITLEQAQAILAILKQECGYTCDPFEGSNFVSTITTGAGEHICHEYRFIGAIGSGGKFRNNGNHDNTPYVDAYSESSTPERLLMIERANKRLAELFKKPIPREDGFRYLADEPPASIAAGHTAPLDDRSTAEMMADRDQKPVDAEPHPRWKPGETHARHPKALDEWDYRNDPVGVEALQRSIRRLNVSGDYEDPREPDQMARVLRVDLTRVLGNLVHKTAAFEFWLSLRPIPIDEWEVVKDKPMLIYVVHQNAQYEKDPKVRQEKWENWTVGTWIDHNGGGWTYYGMMGTVTHVAPLPGKP